MHRWKRVNEMDLSLLLLLKGRAAGAVVICRRGLPDSGLALGGRGREDRCWETLLGRRRPL